MISYIGIELTALAWVATGYFIGGHSRVAVIPAIIGLVGNHLMSDVV
jgi:hypothetical protein